MIFFALLSARLVRAVLRLFKKGATTLPGRAALFFKYDILTRMSQSVRVICVTGTNGKTTTCALIEHALKAAGKSYFINKSGANMISGVTAAFVENCTLFGKCKRDFAILECDENSLPIISRYLDAEVLAVTNIFRDQLDRYGEVTHTLSAIKHSVDNMPYATLVLNADCPLTNSLSLCKNDCVKFGVNADFDAIEVSEARYCPRCSGELKYKSRVFSHLGDYLCTSCGYCRGDVDFEARNITLTGENGSEFELVSGAQKTPVHLSLGGVYNIYNFLCAAAVLDTLGVGGFAAMQEFSGAFGRMETFLCDGNRILLMLIKNPVGFSSCAAYASGIRSCRSVVIALNDNAADGRDVSWIWDSDIDSLCGMLCDFYTFGARANDMTLRLKYNGITIRDTIEGENLAALLELISKQSGDVVIMANYTAMMSIRKALRHSFGGKEFWQ